MTEASKVGCVQHDCDECAKRKRAEFLLKREARALRKSLQRLSDVVLLHIYALDNSTGNDTSVPREASARIGKLVAHLEQQNDLIRYTKLGVDFRKDDKKNVIRKLLRGKK